MFEANYEKTAEPAAGNSLTAANDMNRLLRGEIAAAEAYHQVLAKVARNAETSRLQEFLDDHNEAIAYWRARVTGSGAEADSSSGAWGTTVETFVGTAKLLGDSAALAALREGEEHGLNQYEELLESVTLPEACREHVRDVLIPNQHKHINGLEALMRVQ